MKAMAQSSWAQGSELALIDLPTPAPRDNELRVTVKAIGVNPVDWKMRASGPLRFMARLIGAKPPVVVGVDFAGVVDAVGARVTSHRVGDRVVGGTNFSRKQRGSYADTVIVREDQICTLPDNVEFETGAALPVAGVTAWLSVVTIGRIGTRATSDGAPPLALVLGASGAVGQLAVQIAKSQGAFVVGVCSTRNVELVRALGADVVLDYNAADPLTEAAKVAAQQAPQHRGYQVIVDAVGSYKTSRCRALLCRGGRHAMVAGDSPGSMLSVLVPPFTSKAVLGSTTTKRLQPVVDAVAAGKLRVAIDQRLPLADAERAHELSRGGRMTGKILLLP